MAGKGWVGDLTLFGEFLKRHAVDRRVAAKKLSISASYVSMLARGQATPALKLALRISRWAVETYGAENAFPVERWEA